MTTSGFRRSATRTVLVSLVVLTALSAAGLQPSRSRPLPARDAAEIRLAIERLNVLGSVLYIAAHPDDENTAMLAWLSKGRLVRTGYLAMTRGDGGQNLIGSEKGDLLGVIRTEELLAARSIDGAEQYFSRAIDFGYSKTPEEALSIWGHDEMLSDVVRVIRRFRPDVIVTRFPASGYQSHGHHIASAILANEAFRAAADPERFPDSASEYGVWQARRIYWDSWLPGRPGAPENLDYLTVDLGAYSPLLGRSYNEIASESRSMHKSQGFGAAERRGSQPAYLVLTGGAAAKSDPLDGVDTTWNRVPGSATVADLLRRADSTFDATHPERVVPILLDALEAMDRLPDGYWVRLKRAELLDVIRSATGLWLEAIAEAPSGVPGGTAKIDLRLIDRSGVPIRVESVSAPGMTPVSPAVDLDVNTPWEKTVEVAIPKDAPISQPYWLQEPSDKGHFNVADRRLIGNPENAPAIAVTVALSSGGHRIDYTIPVLYRSTDPVKGERYRPVEIEPRATLAFSDSLLVFPTAGEKPIRVTVRSAVDALRGELSLEVPDGWSVRPENAPVAIDAAGGEAGIDFHVVAPAGETTGRLRAVLHVGDETLSNERHTIDYDHIPEVTVFPDATVRLVRSDIRTEGKSIGYFMGPGDEVPEALRQMGWSVTLLSENDLDRAKLARFDAVVIGIRAFNTSETLNARVPELMAYVENGGTLVEQYVKAGRGGFEGPGPYPFSIGSDRVTVEEAPVTFVHDGDPILERPNRITQRDFDGWVQERGLNFASTWDPRYATVLKMNDPGESPMEGSLLVARVGKGTYIYTGLSFFRQLPAGVPGAYRLFANLVSAKASMTEER